MTGLLIAIIIGSSLIASLLIVVVVTGSWPWGSLVSSIISPSSLELMHDVAIFPRVVSWTTGSPMLWAWSLGGGLVTIWTEVLLCLLIVAPFFCV